MKHIITLVLAALATSCAANAVEQTSSAPRLTIEQLIDIKHPSNADVVAGRQARGLRLGSRRHFQSLRL